MCSAGWCVVFSRGCSVTDPIFSDVAITWIGATACAVYAHFLWQVRHTGAFSGSVRFLFVLLSVLLLVRGFFWLQPDSILLGRMVIAAATLLPMAVTLYSEQLLRRHHPLGLKLVALLVSTAFFAVNLVTALSTGLLIAFLACLLIVLAWNGWLLARNEQGELSKSEIDIARAAALVALMSLPLVLTDFREELGLVPMRVGALGPLIFVHVLLHLTHARHAAARALLRLVAVALSATILSLVFGLVATGTGHALLTTWLDGLPVATAWVLLADILMRTRMLREEANSQNFLRWLLHARMDSLDGLLASLRHLPLTGEHVILDQADIDSYDATRLLAVTANRREPMSLGQARHWIKTGGERLDVGEQWLDLLDRHGMTHALVVSQEPALIILLNLPQNGNLVASEVRMGIIQRIARRIAKAPHAD